METKKPMNMPGRIRQLTIQAGFHECDQQSKGLTWPEERISFEEGGAR